MRGDFERDTAIERAGAGSYTGAVHEAWQVGRGPNGGYVAALVLRALGAAVAEAAPEGNWAPRSLTLHFLRPPLPGPFRIETTVERAGRTLSTLSARLIQGETPYVLALAAFALPRAGMLLADTAPPLCPPPEACPVFATAGGWPAFSQQYEYRWGIGDLPFTGSTHARVGGWIRPRVPAAPTAPLIAALTDSWVPCVFPRLTGPIAAPTVDLTIHFRAALPLANASPEDWYLATFSSRLGAEGFFEEDGEVWSRDGVLLAQSRQLALLPEE